MPLEIDGELTYRAPEVCRLAGITYRQLDYWARLGHLEPSIRDARGSGSQRLYSSDDVKKARAIAKLLHLGIRHGGLRPLLADPMGTIQDMIDQLEAVQKEYQTPLEELVGA